jgi:hypothetical protein
MDIHMDMYQKSGEGLWVCGASKGPILTRNVLDNGLVGCLAKNNQMA